MAKLTPNQRQILETAAGRRDGAILPLPKGVAVKGDASTATLASLVKRGMVTDYKKAKRPVITKAGRAAVGAEAYKGKANGKSRSGKKGPDTGIRRDTKKGRLLALLNRPEGAAIADLMTTTGWQAHSVRAALTGFRKRGYEIERRADGGASRYRIVGKHKAA